MDAFLFSHFLVTNVKKFLKYYSLNVRKPLEIDTTPEISKILVQQYVLGLPRHTQN